MRVPRFHCTPQLWDALGEAPGPQPGNSLQDLRQHFRDKGQTMRAAQPLGFLDARQQLLGFAAVIPNLAAHGERKAEVEGVATPACVRIVGKAELHGTIRIAQHPGSQGNVDADSRLRVDVHEVCEVAVLLLVIQRQHSVAMRAGLGQISPPKWVMHAARVPRSTIRIAAGFRSRQHFIDPVQRLSDAALDQHIHPQSAVDRQ